MSKNKFEIRRKTPPASAKSPWVEKLCEACAEPFWVIPSAAKNALTCSRKCKNAWQASRRETIKCKWCGTEKIFYKSESREFCSSRCQYKSQSGYRHSRWVKERVGNCLQCQKEYPKYVVRPSGAAVGRENYSERKFCSPECRKLFRRCNPYPRDAKIGDVYQWADGYRYIKVHGRGWVSEHRYVIEQQVGRKLSSEEHVHHRFANKSDNNPDNLRLLSKSEHRSLHSRAEKLGLILMALDGWEDLLEKLEEQNANNASTADRKSSVAKWTNALCSAG